MSSEIVISTGTSSSIRRISEMIAPATRPMAMPIAAPLTKSSPASQIENVPPTASTATR